MSQNKGILLNGALTPKVLNIPFACSLINLYFLLLHKAHFVGSIFLPLLVLEGQPVHS